MPERGRPIPFALVQQRMTDWRANIGLSPGWHFGDVAAAAEIPTLQSSTERNPEGRNSAHQGVYKLVSQTQLGAGGQPNHQFVIGSRAKIPCQMDRRCRAPPQGFCNRASKVLLSTQSVSRGLVFVARIFNTMAGIPRLSEWPAP